MAKYTKKYHRLSPEMIDRLNNIGFPWVAGDESELPQWFNAFYKKLIEYKNKEILGKNGKIKKPKGSFAGVRCDAEIGMVVNSIRRAKNGRHSLKLAQEMIDLLDEIDFIWEARPKKVQEDNLSV